jgi:hypothetical protein
MLRECLIFSSMRLGVPFIAPRQLGDVGDQFGRPFLPSVEWCTTGQPLFMSGALSPSISGATDRCSSGPVGAPDTVWCTPDSPVCPTDRWSETRVARRLRSRPLAAGGIGSPDSPVIYSRTPPSIPESSQFNAGQPGAPDTVRCARPSWSWLHTANSFPFLFCFFCHCF